MTDDERAKSAENYARRVISGSFKQQIDDETLDSVVEKLVQALPEQDTGAKDLK